MIIYEDHGNRPMPLLAPQLMRRGPYAPGEDVEIEVPLANESRVAVRNLRMRLHADDPAFQPFPTEVSIDLIEGGKMRTIPAKVHLPDRLPDEIRTRAVKVWATLHPEDGQPLETLPVEIIVEARAKLTVEIVDGHLCIENTGTAAARIRIEADKPLPEAWPTELSIAASGNVEALALPEEPLGPIRVITEDGDRAVVMHRRGPRRGPRLDAHAVAMESPDAVHPGDVVPFEIQILNAGSTAYDAVVTIPRRKGVEFAEGFATRDNVPLLPSDISIDENEVRLVVGVLREGETTKVRGALRIGELEADPDILVWDGRVTAEQAEARFRFSVRIAQTPKLATHDTYFTPLAQGEGRGELVTTIRITHPHRLPIESAGLVLESKGAQVRRIVDIDNDVEIKMSADSMGTSSIIGDIGEIPAQSRRSFEVHLQRLPGARDVRIEAELMTAGQTVPLDYLEESLPVEALPRVELLVTGAPKVRLGSPYSLKIALQNDGTEGLRKVRLRPILPEGMELEFPHTAKEGEWYLLGLSLPPDGEVAFPALLSMTAPPTGDAVEIAMEVDGENAPAFRSPSVEVRTPSSPLVRVSEPQFRETGERGLVEVRVRITNRSDGTARDVSIMVPATDHPVHHTAMLDGVPVDERDSAGSILLEGMSIGDLPPNSQRDVAWLVAPNDKIYVAHVTVRAAGGVERTVRGSLDLHGFRQFATAPSAPHAIDESKPLTGYSQTRKVESRVESVREEAPSLPPSAQPSNVLGAAAADGPRALGPSQGEEHSNGTTSTAKPTASAAASSEPRSNGHASPASAAASAVAVTPLTEAQPPVDQVLAPVAATTDGKTRSRISLTDLADQIVSESRPSANGDASPAAPAAVEPVQQDAKAAVAEPAAVEPVVAHEPEAPSAPEPEIPSASTETEPEGSAENMDELEAEILDELQPEGEDEIESELLAGPSDEERQIDEMLRLAETAPPPAVDQAVRKMMSDLDDVAKPVPQEIGDLGLMTLASFFGLLPKEIHDRAIVQAIAVRLIGPSSSQRHIAARDVLVKAIGSLPGVVRIPSKLESWCRETLRRIDEHIENSCGGAGGIANAEADAEAVGEVFHLSGIPVAWEAAFGDYRGELTDRLPMDTDDSVPYPALLWNTKVPTLAAKLDALIAVATERSGG